MCAVAYHNCLAPDDELGEQRMATRKVETMQNALHQRLHGHHRLQDLELAHNGLQVQRHISGADLSHCYEHCQYFEAIEQLHGVPQPHIGYVLGCLLGARLVAAISQMLCKIISEITVWISFVNY